MDSASDVPDPQALAAFAESPRWSAMLHCLRGQALPPWPAVRGVVHRIPDPEAWGDPLATAWELERSQPLPGTP